MKPLIPKRIYNEELTKALYLNNQNPEKYNLTFFSDYFGVEPRDLQDVFDSVSFPLVNAGDNSVFRIYRFVYL